MTSQSITCRVLILAGALSGGFVAAQPPPRQVALTPEVGTDDIRQVATRLRALQGGGLPPGLLDDVRKLLGENRGATPEQLAEKLRQQHPELQNPERLAQLQDWIRQYRGQVRPGELPRPEFDPSRLPRPPMPPPSMPKPPPFPPTRVETPPPSTVPPPSVEEPKPPQVQPPVGPGNSREPRAGVPPTPPPQFPQGTPNSAISPEQLNRRQEQLRAVMGWWEKNVGPLNETPAVRQLLVEMFTGQSDADSGTLGDLFDGSGEGLGRFAENLSTEGWELPELGWGPGRLGDLGGFSAPSPPSAGGASFGTPEGSGSWLPVILFVAIVAGGLVLWWLWPKLSAHRSDGPRPLPGLGPWPVDPRTIADREALVKAFEYLSVLLCGASARSWNHVTIAEALRRAVPEAEALAEPLARLYAVARYTPAGEPLPPEAIPEARGYLCELAGVAAP